MRKRKIQENIVQEHWKGNMFFRNVKIRNQTAQDNIIQKCKFWDGIKQKNKLLKIIKIEIVLNKIFKVKNIT